MYVSDLKSVQNITNESIKLTNTLSFLFISDLISDKNLTKTN